MDCTNNMEYNQKTAQN